MEFVSLSSFKKPYAHISIDPGESKTIWEAKRGYDYPDVDLWIYGLAVKYLPDCEVIMEVDGERVETFQWQVGEIERPLKLDPPMLVKGYIKFIGKNNSSSSQVFEVLVDGRIITKR